MRVEFVDAALQEASDAATRYEAEVPGLGDEFLDELERCALAVGEQPETWLTIGSVGLRPVRRFLLSRFPYGLVYMIKEDHVLVVAVAHGRRRPRYWAGRVPRT